MGQEGPEGPVLSRSAMPSLEKRGLSRGAANAFQMFHETEHRLAFPVSESLKNLQCTVDGKNMPPMRYSEAPTLKRRMDTTMEPSLQTIATHLAELVENPASLPVALARALAGEGAWEGLGLLSGSSIIDIVTALTLFCTQYGPGNWAALLRQELPGLTEDVFLRRWNNSNHKFLQLRQAS